MSQVHCEKINMTSVSHVSVSLISVNFAPLIAMKLR